jgi:hypothetical protein
MAIFEIPLPQTNGAEFSFNTVLFGVSYTFRFFFNIRDQSWSIDMLAPDGSPIMQGQRAITGYDLMAIVTDNRKPPGYLLLIDTATGGAGTEPGINDLGRRVQMVYNDLL